MFKHNLNCLFPFQRNSDARKLYYAELKGRFLKSECFEQEGMYFQLAAFALQADLGDCEEQNFAYFSPQGFFPFWVRCSVYICWFRFSKTEKTPVHLFLLLIN